MKDQNRVDSEGIVVLARASAFDLGVVEVRPATREVIGPDGREQLEPRVMQVLVALHGAGGEVVGRDALIRDCWNGRIVTEDAINRVIARIRRVGETVGKGSFGVETIIKVGYRLWAGQADSDADAEAAFAGPQARQPVPHRRAVLAAGAALAVTGAGGAWWLRAASAASVPEAALRLREEGLAASRLGTAEGTAQAVGYLQEAVAIAPAYAEGWGSLALAYQSGEHFAAAEAVQGIAQRVRSAARRALALDSANASAHAALALAIPPFGNWLAAERALRSVLELDPAQFESCAALSRILASVGRTRAAIAVLSPIGEPIRMQPAMQYWLAFLLWCAGRLDESDRIVNRAMTLWPRNYQVWFTRFWIWVFTGKADHAIAMLADVENRPLGIPEWNFRLIGESARAVLIRSSTLVEAALGANLTAARSGLGFAENTIELASELGRPDTAYAVAEAYYFGRGFAVGPTRYTTQQGSYTPPSRRNTKFLFNPSTAAMRADERFRRLVRELGLADYWQRSATSADVVAPRPR